MIRKTDHIAGASAVVYLESATRSLEHGDLVGALTFVDEGIAVTEDTGGLDVRNKLKDLRAFIVLKERIGENESISILGRHYYAGADADIELMVVHHSPAMIVH